MNKVIKQEELLDFAKQTFNKCLEVLRNKNTDYCSVNDAYSNFKNYGRFGLKITVEEGILTRIIDKTSRLINITYRKNTVKDETVEDTIDDLINYLILLKCWIKRK